MFDLFRGHPQNLFLPYFRATLILGDLGVVTKITGQTNSFWEFLNIKIVHDMTGENIPRVLFHVIDLTRISPVNK